MATSVLPDYNRDLHGGELDSSHLELGIDDLRAITEVLTNSPHTTLTDLATAAQHNYTVTRVTLTVNPALVHRVFPIMNILFQNLMTVSALRLSFVVGPSLAPLSFVGAPWHTLDLGLLSSFLRCCLHGATRLTSISLLVPEGSFASGTFDWSFFHQFKNLRSFSFHKYSGLISTNCLIDFESMVRELSALERLETVVARGVFVNIGWTYFSDSELINRFICGRSLETLELGSLAFFSGDILQSLASGLRRSAIKHLHLGYLCPAIDESSSVIEAIAACTEFCTLSFEGGRIPHRPPFVGGAKLLLANTRLTSFRLKDFTISDDEARSMSLALVRRCCVLEKLELSGCDMSYVAVGILLSSLTAHTSIRDVCIRGNPWIPPIAAFDETVLVPLEVALETVAKAPLTSLRLVEYFIEPSVSRARAQAMAQCLRRNQHLETIEISYLDEDHQSLLDSIGRLNAAGRRNVLASGSKKAGVELLGKVSSNVNDVFLHLCENPSLCVCERPSS